MNRMLHWLDNPILVKHARSRLRRGQLIPALAMTMVVSLCFVLWGYQYDRLHSDWTFNALLAIQAILMGIVGANQVGSSVAKARESGLMDFHRASPMAPMSQAVGFFFGAPIREYLLFAAILPFSLICMVSGWPDFKTGCELIAGLVLITWVMHAFALLNALLWKPSKSATRGLIVLVGLILGVGSMIGSVTSGSWMKDEDNGSPMLNFFGARFPALVVMMIDLLPVVGFLMVASARKLASEKTHPLSKAQAISCLGAGAFLLMGNLWDLADTEYVTLIVLYALIATAFVLIVTITPNQGEYSKGVRQSLREGQKTASAWTDRALNRTALIGLCLVVLVAPTVAWYAIEFPSNPPGQAPVSYSLPIAIGVLVVAYFGLAVQFFQIRAGKRGMLFLVLFLFVVWIVPVVVGTISMVGDAKRGLRGPSAVSLSLVSLSPVAGITLSSGVPVFETSSSDHQVAQGCALMPALIFAFLFNNLVVATRRKITREVQPDREPFEKPGAVEFPEIAQA